MKYCGQDEVSDGAVCWLAYRTEGVGAAAEAAAAAEHASIPVVKKAAAEQAAGQVAADDDSDSEFSFSSSDAEVYRLRN
jgi:hypothetical protein